MRTTRHLTKDAFRLALASLMTFLAMNAASAQAPAYTIIDLGTLGGDFTTPTAINAEGQVVGISSIEPGGSIFHAFLWEKGVMADLGLLPNGIDSAAADINDEGIVVGWARVETAQNPQTRAVRWVSGQIVDMHPAGSFSSEAHGVNGHGDVVGLARIADGTRRATLWPGSGGLVVLPGLSDSDSNSIFDLAVDVNDAGEIVGFATTDPDELHLHAVHWRNQSIQDLHFDSELSNSAAAAVNRHGEITGTSQPDQPELPEFVSFYHTVSQTVAGPAGFVPHGINGNGQVVGEALFAGEARAALWQNGLLIDLNTRLPEDSGWVVTIADGINDDGVIIGSGLLDGQSRAFRMEPPSIDQDGDGLLDLWESEGGGLDIDGDGAIDLDLYARGARADHKDLFIEVDAMNGLPDVSAALAMVTEAFEAAPVSNPDGMDGISLHVELIETALPVGDWDKDDLDGDGHPDWPNEFDTFKGMYWGSPAERADPNAINLLAAKRLAYRYGAVVDELNTPGSDQGYEGLGELPGNDFIIALGVLESYPYLDKVIAGLFMHEFGHTLGLHHGGADDVNFKPNYISVMNYSWTYPSGWNTVDWFLDYSRFELLALDEGNLDETAGMGGPAYSRYLGLDMLHGATEAGGRWHIGFSSPYDDAYCDWNANGDEEEMRVAVDLNRIRESHDPSPGQILLGQDDWSAIGYGLIGGINYGDAVHLASTDDDLAADLHAYLDSIPPPPADCPADLNGDGAVAVGDLVELILAWGSCPGPCPADFDRNGAVDVADLIELILAWGPCV